MTCSLFDVQCHLSTFIAGLWWLPWVVYGLLGVFALVALAKVKELAGWPGVFAVLTLGAYGLGYARGRSGQSINPIEQLPEDHPDAAPSFNDLIKPRPAKPNTRKLTDEELKRIMYGSGNDH
jgi:hypothetical protein